MLSPKTELTNQVKTMLGQLQTMLLIMHDTVLVTILTTVFQHHGSPVIIRNILTYVPIQPKRSCTIRGRQNRRTIRQK